MRNKLKLIIGLGPRARIGKDFAADLICQRYPGVGRFAFADQLKADLFQLVWERTHINLFNPTDQERALVRPTLVGFGELMRNAVSEDYWVDRLMMKLEDCKADLIVVTDVRYPNEVRMINSLSGRYLHIDAPDVQPANDSEAKWTPVLEGMSDATLTNRFDNDFAIDLMNQVDEWLEQYGLAEVKEAGLGVTVG